MVITEPFGEVGKIYEVSGAAARTGNFKKQEWKELYKKRRWRGCRKQQNKRPKSVYRMKFIWYK